MVTSESRLLANSWFNYGLVGSFVHFARGRVVVGGHGFGSLGACSEGLFVAHGLNKCRETPGPTGLHADGDYLRGQHQPVWSTLLHVLSSDIEARFLSMDYSNWENWPPKSLKINVLTTLKFDLGTFFSCLFLDLILCLPSCLKVKTSHLGLGKVAAKPLTSVAILHLTL